MISVSHWGLIDISAVRVAIWLHRQWIEEDFPETTYQRLNFGPELT